MKVTSVREFRDNASTMFKSVEPILITKRSKLAGLYIPFAGDHLPIEMKNELLDVITGVIRKNLDEQGISEEDIDKDFEDFRRHSR